MDKKKIIAYTTGGLLAAALLALLVMWIMAKVLERRAYNPDEKKDGSENGSGSGNGGGNGTGSGKAELGTFPLQWGSGTIRNANPENVKRFVKSIQTICNYWTVPTLTPERLTVDGIWGDKTEAAVANLKKVTSPGNPSIKPFVYLIKPVEKPVNNKSKWQIPYEDYKILCNAHNLYINS